MLLRRGPGTEPSSAVAASPSRAVCGAGGHPDHPARRSVGASRSVENARDGIIATGDADCRLPGEVTILAGSSTRSRTRSLGLVGLGIVGSGLLVYAYLAIIARSVSAAEYAYFGAFWSLALVAGFGVFLPIEQETARLMQVPNRPRALLRAALLTALAMAGVQVALVAVASSWLAGLFGGHPVTVVAFALLCLVSAGQFVVRGR